MRMIVVFDNLVQQHKNGILGDTENVRAVCRSEEEFRQLEIIGERADKAGEAFQKRFRL
jgi:hypothetical protein